VYPIVKYALIRADAADLQVSYSLAGPTILSSDVLDGVPTGTNRFIFQDLIGIAVCTGRARNVLVGLGLGHYSNGNLLPINPGINIPLTLTVGYAF
jgi:Lipid A 3-O-deacylase (PagL)